MKANRKGTFFNQAILEDHFAEDFRRQFINRNETDLSPVQRIVLKRFYVRRETVAEIAERLKIKVDEVCSLLESGVTRVRKTEKRVLQKTEKFPLSRIPSCEKCGRRLKAPYRDVFCASCIRAEVHPLKNVSEAS
jgi:DNA-binding CsgD family transcriptional regulator